MLTMFLQMRGKRIRQSECLCCDLPVWPRTSYPPGRVFTDEQAVAGTPNILLSCGGVLDGLGENKQYKTQLPGNQKPDTKSQGKRS